MGTFIGPDQIRQMISGLVDHASAQSMQQVPDACITAKTHLPLELGGANSWCVS